jgi:hypothetical protein
MVRNLLLNPCLNRVAWRLCVFLAAWHGIAPFAANTDALADKPDRPDENTSAEFSWSGTNLELGSAIRMARLSGSLNILIDPWIETNTVGSANPLKQKVTFHYEKTAPSEAMGLLLGLHGLHWRWNDSIQIGRVTSPASPNATNDCSELFQDASLLSLASTNILDELSFDEAPLNDVLTKLARETGLNVIWNASLLFGPSHDTNAAPKLTFSLKSVTGLQALAGLGENQGLALVWNAHSTVLRVTTRSSRIWEIAHPMPESLPAPSISSATNAQQLIFLDAIPLDQVIGFLCHQAGIGFIMAPELAGNTNNPFVEGKFKNLDTMRILEALLENYGLAAIEDDEAKTARIVSRECIDKQRKWTNPSPIPPIIDPLQPPPQIAMQNATLESAVDMLARQCGINLLYSPALASERRQSGASRLKKSNVYFEFLKTTPRQALSALLANFDLAVVWDSAANIGHVADLNRYSDYSFSAVIPEKHWGEAAPELVFDDVPLPIVLRLLAGQCGIGLEIEEDKKEGNKSKVSLDFEAIQPGRVFNALCASHRLTATWNEEGKTVRIAASGQN